jgi:hypothetical protein
MRHPLSAKGGTNFADKRRSLGIVRLRTKSNGVFLTLYPQKLELNSPTSGGSSVGIVRLRTKSHGVFFSVRNNWNTEAVIFHCPVTRHTVSLIWVLTNTEQLLSNLRFVY